MPGQTFQKIAGIPINAYVVIRRPSVSDPWMRTISSTDGDSFRPLSTRSDFTFTETA
jgi:hypothetical protein